MSQILKYHQFQVVPLLGKASRTKLEACCSWESYLEARWDKERNMAMEEYTKMANKRSMMKMWLRNCKDRSKELRSFWEWLFLISWIIRCWRNSCFHVNQNASNTCIKVVVRLKWDGIQVTSVEKCCSRFSISMFHSSVLPNVRHFWYRSELTLKDQLFQ